MESTDFKDVIVKNVSQVLFEIAWHDFWNVIEKKCMCWQLKSLTNFSVHNAASKQFIHMYKHWKEEKKLSLLKLTNIVCFLSKVSTISFIEFLSAYLYDYLTHNLSLL